jgi:hypothetical protein
MAGTVLISKADCGKSWRMGDSSPTAGEPDISCLIAACSENCEPD